MSEIHEEAHKEFSPQFDENRIESARQEFRKKDFKKSISIFRKVENTNLFNELDKKIIEYCDQHI